MFRPVGSAAECDQAVLTRVRQAFADALGLSLAEVHFESSIMGDLGAESLDLLDIAFRLERAFDVRIPRGGVEATSKQGLGEGEVYEVGGVLTRAALDKLAEAMPEVPAADLREGLKVSEVATLLRVGTFYNIVQGLLAQKAG